MAARAGILVTSAVGLVLVAGSAWAQQTGVSIQVFNRSFVSIDARIVDVVCGDVLFEGQIFNESAVLVTACTNADGRATITVEDRSGQAKTYTGLEAGSQVQFEPDQD